MVDNVRFSLFAGKGIEVHVKRDDLLHPVISGNKWRKLKYNLKKVLIESHDTILTFGGAYSNHLVAVARACKDAGMKSIGVVRGEKTDPLNPSLKDAQNDGMLLHYIERSAYRQKTEPAFISSLQKRFGNFYLIPEGGANAEGIKGCEEILENLNSSYDYICTACGTGATLAGMLNSPWQKRASYLGFPVLKAGSEYLESIKNLVSTSKSWRLIEDYHLGGYAKVNLALFDFMDDFELKAAIPLDPVYTGKMFFGICDLIQKDFFPVGTKILLIHTGGIQGNRGFGRKVKCE